MTSELERAKQELVDAQKDFWAIPNKANFATYNAAFDRFVAMLDEELEP